MLYSKPRQSWFLHGLIIMLALALSPLAIAATNTVSTIDSGARAEERKSYKSARTALNQKNIAQYKKDLAKLKHYPLLPYLEYDELSSRLSALPRKDVDLFLAKYPDSFLADRLSHRWLRTLADKALWQDYLNFYQPRLASDPELTCYYLQARLKANDLSAFNDVAPLWNQGKSQPKACDSVFKLWVDAGYRTPSLVNERLGKSLTAGNRSLATYLSNQLPANEQALAKLWIDVDGNPRLLAQTAKFSQQSAATRNVIIYGLTKLARQDAQTALALWQKYDAQQLFEDQQRTEFQFHLASRLMRQSGSEKAEALLSKMTGNTRTDLAEWMIRDALRKQDWERAYQWWNKLSAEDKQTERWSYWQARLMEALKIKELDGKNAQTIYAQVANTRSFYGFLSADKLGLDYRLVDQPMQISPQTMSEISQNPGVLRAQELYLVGEHTAANREWYHSIRQMSTEQIVAAGRLASIWGWHRNGIQAMIEAQHWDDLSIRFPLAYHGEVQQAAAKIAMNPLFLLAIARQESAFREDARSPVGAMGLMQLMPATAKQTAQRSGIPFTPQDLLKPEKNIVLGSRYLNQLLNQFNGNRILAAAAYNAGPSRVNQWLSKDAAKLPYDIWIETIPFQETRGYVQNVLSFSVIYAYRTGTKQAIITEEEARRAL